MESFRKIGTIFAALDGATPDALAFASLPELADAIVDRLERLTPASPASDVLDLIDLVETCGCGGLASNDSSQTRQSRAMRRVRSSRSRVDRSRARSWLQSRYYRSEA
jgi:hypothetical protein